MTVLKARRMVTEKTKNCYLKLAWTHNSPIRTDLPLIVVTKASRRKLAETLRLGQLFCVGKVYIKTHNGTIRIK